MPWHPWLPLGLAGGAALLAYVLWPGRATAAATTTTAPGSSGSNTLAPPRSTLRTELPTAEVTTMQRDLIAVGCLPAGRADGAWGPQTDDAVGCAIELMGFPATAIPQLLQPLTTAKARNFAARLRAFIAGGFQA
jgi:peptidoglycan hydrolase-like protein with peptidoglycan-binding domain